MEKKRVLLIDPPAGFAAAGAPIFSRVGFDVDVVPATLEAIEPTMSVRYHLICAGLPLPEPVLTSLFKAIRAAGSASQGSSVIVTASDPESTDVRTALANGANAVLRWPSPAPEVVERLAAALDIAPRKAIRVFLKLRIKLASSTRTSFCQSENLSFSGVLLRTSELVPIGEKVILELMLPGDPEPRTARATVVRHVHPRRERISGLGLRFDSFDGDAEAKLATLLSTH